MIEIGGYIEFEHYLLPMLHENAIALNCGRNCLAYLIEANRIKKIALPYFLCDSVIDLCKFYGLEIRYYHINEKFLPENILLDDDEWVYIVNYYGQVSSSQILELQKQYSRLIVDNAQAYFDLPVEGIDTLYTCRKFFGVPDGAFLYTNSFIERGLEQDESFERMHFLLGRYERKASEFYDEYVNNNIMFESEPIKKMSKLTQNLLHSFDYKRIKRIRTDNYAYISDRLGKKNLLNPKKVEGAFAYPLMLENGAGIKKKLIEKKVYIPTLWPNVLENSDSSSLDYKLAEQILPIPCDQRYGEEELEYVCTLINVLENSKH